MEELHALIEQLNELEDEYEDMVYNSNMYEQFELDEVYELIECTREKIFMIELDIEELLHEDFYCDDEE